MAPTAIVFRKNPSFLKDAVDKFDEDATEMARKSKTGVRRRPKGGRMQKMKTKVIFLLELQAHLIAPKEKVKRNLSWPRRPSLHYIGNKNA